jgi:hypothetical protein
MTEELIELQDEINQPMYTITDIELKSLQMAAMISCGDKGELIQKVVDKIRSRKVCLHTPINK